MLSTLLLVKIHNKSLSKTPAPTGRRKIHACVVKILLFQIEWYRFELENFPSNLKNRFQKPKSIGSITTILMYISPTLSFPWWQAKTVGSWDYKLPRQRERQRADQYFDSSSPPRLGCSAELYHPKEISISSKRERKWQI